MIPFNKQRALNGDKLVTRSGLNVVNFKTISDNDLYCYEAYIVHPSGLSRGTYTVLGRHIWNEPSRYDLFMANEISPSVSTSVNIKLELPKFKESVVISNSDMLQITKPFDPKDVRIFIGYSNEGYSCVTEGYEDAFLKGNPFKITNWHYAIPVRLFTENPVTLEIGINHLVDIFGVDKNHLKINYDD